MQSHYLLCLQLRSLSQHGAAVERLIQRQEQLLWELRAVPAGLRVLGQPQQPRERGFRSLLPLHSMLELELGLGKIPGNAPQLGLSREQPRGDSSGASVSLRRGQMHCPHRAGGVLCRARLCQAVPCHTVPCQAAGDSARAPLSPAVTQDKSPSPRRFLQSWK